MIGEVIKTRLFLLGIILFLCIGFCPAYGQQAYQDGEDIRIFTRDIVVEFTYAGRDSDITKEELRALSNELAVFFSNFKYGILSHTLQGLLLDGDRYKLTQDIDRAVQWLDRNKDKLFGSIQINPEQYYEIKAKENNSFATISVNRSGLNLTAEETDFMLMVFSLGMTAEGPFYLKDKEYTLKGVSVNWMMVGQFMSGMTTGAPAGLPIKPKDPVTEADYAIDASGISGLASPILPAFEFPKEIIKTRLPSKEKIDVYILDTLPEITALFEGYVFYNKNKVIKNIFSLIGTEHSIQYNGCLDPDFNTYLNENYGNRNLSDHGTFIAGIINLLSPDSRLHLIEVMNHYAAGTLDSLLWGFQEVLDQVDNDNPFVVNTSLTTKLRFPDKENKYNEEITDIRIKMIYGLQKPELFLTLLFDAVELIKNHNGVVIAAAGNDSKIRDHHDAGYPARFKDVIGVGSTQRNGKISSFSNEPGTGGFLAFGGEVNSSKITTDGILSIYLSSPYTDSTDANTSGWGIWSGSSFATGMVSGAVAALLSQGESIPGAILTLRSSSTASGGFDVLPVKQGL
ncbi:MAG: S8/S53 family peptidase [Spirochaetales bacterium]|nr:S8/S53 family peptidase [Spirochaetales bacterium]